MLKDFFLFFLRISLSIHALLGSPLVLCHAMRVCLMWIEIRYSVWFKECK